MIKRILFRVALAISYLVCAFLSDKFMVHADLIFRMCIVSFVLSLLSAFWRFFLIVEEYPGFYKSVLEAWVLITLLVLYIIGSLNWLFILLFAYILFFPSAYITYFVLQGYEVRRSGGH